MSPTLRLGAELLDLSTRVLVVGVLNRTRDSFSDPAPGLELDGVLRRADRLAQDGADVIEIGAAPGGVGVRPVPPAEETDLVCEAITAIRETCDLPLAVDTRRAEVAAAAYGVGAVIGNDMGSFRDPAFLQVSAAAGATVVATHCRLPPGVADPDPQYADVVEDVAGALTALVRLARRAGVAADRIVVDPGLDLGKTWQQSVRLTASLDRFAALGCPLMVAASNKIFLGELLHLPVDRRLLATVAVNTAGVLWGARLLRVHDAAAGRQVADLAAALLDARTSGGQSS